LSEERFLQQQPGVLVGHGPFRAAEAGGHIRDRRRLDPKAQGTVGSVHAEFLPVVAGSSLRATVLILLSTQPAGGLSVSLVG
jgi:hypothetical protein